ncbi:uncharacterized protein MYCFIDRAFT_183842 [Pseudocercospora fijiensis CIRAD86]|uniref:Secreted protein n=1 Tax=Pseudocercospora fijiensis (strain CIRAD86) TaxID=383855 RepID=M2YKL3_PSEFD|nr:uncharacterized protein MYCFIDRAFT_183842 [Pseudocercospora fijiensis CIRAD86]EME78255.1 hypothetical protein MYCFIDRAFT_183842 [Pseudocercospora fijiensis CIRAD86]
MKFHIPLLVASLTAVVTCGPVGGSETNSGQVVLPLRPNFVLIQVTERENEDVTWGPPVFPDRKRDNEDSSYENYGWAFSDKKVKERDNEDSSYENYGWAFSDKKVKERDNEDSSYENYGWSFSDKKVKERDNEDSSYENYGWSFSDKK